MLLNPYALKRAQEEIDRVIGPDRLPVPADRPSLPYIDALTKETLRWQVVAPLGYCRRFTYPEYLAYRFLGFHLSTKDDIYQGYHIPKGAVIFANIWSILLSNSLCF